MRGLRLLSNGLTPIILVAAIAAIGAWVLRASVARRVRAERLSEQMVIATTEVRRGEFEVAVEAMGKLEAVSSRSVIVEVSGQVVSLLPNGVEVKEGDIIAELDAPRMLRQLRDQEIQYQETRDDLKAKQRDLAAEIEKARIKLEQTRQELQRYRTAQDAELTQKRSQKAHDTENLELTRARFEREKTLSAEGLVPQREIDLATAAIKATEFNLEKQSKDLDLAEAERSSEEMNKQAAVTKAEAELARAESRQQDDIQTATVTLQIRENQLERVRSQFDKSVIRAPVDGIVLFEEQSQGMMGRRPLQPGDQVWQGRPIATIPALDDMRVALELSQQPASQAEEGQEAFVVVPALPGQTFPGEVTDIAQTGRDSTFAGTGLPRGERAFPVLVHVKDRKGALLRPGMTALVRIIVERIPEAVTVPLACVFERDDRHIVYVRQERGFRAVEVELGPKSDDEVVIADGLRGEEKVALRDVSADTSDSSATGESQSPSALPL